VFGRMLLINISVDLVNTLLKSVKGNKQSLCSYSRLN
jgi:hypothetical protein